MGEGPGEGLQKGETTLWVSGLRDLNVRDVVGGRDDRKV